MNKQIEEMATILAQSGCVEACVECECYGINLPKNVYCDQMRFASEIYRAGYRKQSEVVRCKDCEYFYQDGILKVCRHWNCHSTEDDAYCSFAKMKGGETDA